MYQASSAMVFQLNEAFHINKMKFFISIKQSGGVGMSFFVLNQHISSHKTKLNKKNEIILQVHSIYKSMAYITPNKKETGQKRMSLCLRTVSGAISVEAALVIPLFIFFMANLMMLILVFRDYSYSYSKLQQKARGLALASVNTNDDSELITLQKEMSIAPLIKEMGFNKSNTHIEVTYRKWTGYDICGGAEDILDEEYVYVAEYGTVYHKSRNCKHLSIQMKIVTDNELVTLRNNNMEKYSRCEICNGQGSGIYFVTNGGNRYHGSANCSGLKRTVRIVKLSEVNGLPPCSICGR